jgi:hypothetical protein
VRSGLEPVTVLGLDVLRFDLVADIRGDERAVGRDTGGTLRERVRDRRDPRQALDPLQCRFDGRPRLRVRDLSALDVEDDGRVGSGERRRMCAEEVDRLLRLGARDREVVRRGG